MQHKGDLIVDGRHERWGQVTGTTYVRRGGELIAHGQLAGGLVVEPGGHAIVHGQVPRNVVNHGHLTLYGQVSGRIIGSPPVNPLGPDQILGTISRSRSAERPQRGAATIPFDPVAS